MNDCPDTEQLAEFIDGRLAPDRRAAVVAHLLDCKMCYAVVSDSLTVREELSRRSHTRRYRSLFAYAVPSALAAAAVLLLVLKVWYPVKDHRGTSASALAHRTEPARPSPQVKENGKRTAAVPPRSFAGDLAARLMSTAKTEELKGTEGAPPRPRTSFGFSSAVTPDKAAFRIGMCLTRLEIARANNDRQTAEEADRQLTELLRIIGPSSGVAHPVVAQSESNRYAGYSASLEAQFGTKKELVYLKLGAWVEAAGRAAEANDAAFFVPAEVRAFTAELKERNEPVGTLNDLSKLESIISSGDIRPDQFRTITRLLADVREMF